MGEREKNIKMEIFIDTEIEIIASTRIPKTEHTYLQKRNHPNADSNRYMHPNIHSSTIYNSQDTEAT